MKKPFDFDFDFGGLRLTRFGNRSYSLPKRIDLTHGVAFIAGIALTFGFFVADESLSKTAYSKTVYVAAAVKTIEPPTMIVSTTTENLVDDENRDSEGMENEEVVKDDEEIVASKPKPVPAPIVEQAAEAPLSPTSVETQAQVEEALASAQAALEAMQASEQAAQPKDETPAYFVTPNGIKIDANGNVITDDPSTSSGQATQSTPPPSSTVSSPQGTQTVVAEGYFQLPTGKWTDANGNLFDEPPMITQYVSTQQQNEYFTTPGGVVMDRNGVIISRPEEPEKEYIPVTHIDPNSLPENGSIINIPIFVASAVYGNQGLNCSQLSLYGNDVELCKIYKANRDDYTWVEVDTPDI